MERVGPQPGLHLATQQPEQILQRSLQIGDTDVGIDIKPFPVELEVVASISSRRQATQGHTRTGGF